MNLYIGTSELQHMTIKLFLTELLNSIYRYESILAVIVIFQFENCSQIVL